MSKQTDPHNVLESDAEDLHEVEWRILRDLMLLASSVQRPLSSDEDMRPIVQRHSRVRNWSSYVSKLARKGFLKEFTIPSMISGQMKSWTVVFDKGVRVNTRVVYRPSVREGLGEMLDVENPERTNTLDQLHVRLFEKATLTSDVRLRTLTRASALEVAKPFFRGSPLGGVFREFQRTGRWKRIDQDELLVLDPSAYAEREPSAPFPELNIEANSEHEKPSRKRSRKKSELPTEDVYPADTVPVALSPMWSRYYPALLEEARTTGFVPVSLSWFRAFITKQGITVHPARLRNEGQYLGLIRFISGTLFSSKDPPHHTLVRRPVRLNGRTDVFVPPECSIVNPPLSLESVKPSTIQEALEQRLTAVESLIATVRVQAGMRADWERIRAERLETAERLSQEAVRAQAELAAHLQAEPLVPMENLVDLEAKLSQLRRAFENVDLADVFAELTHQG